MTAVKHNRKLDNGDVVVEKENQLSFIQSLQVAYKYRGFSVVIARATKNYLLNGPSPAISTLEIGIFLGVIRHAFTLRSPPKEDEDAIQIMQRVRKSIDFKYAPKVKSGVFPEIEIVVKERKLGGVLKEVDALEDGTRTIKAEWTAHNGIFDEGKPPSSAVLLYFHGGAFVFGSPITHRNLTIGLSRAMNCRVLSVDYRLSPETKFPGALHDAVSALHYLFDTGIAPSNIYVGGDSAGGNLATVLLLYLSREGIRLGGGVLMSPWVDFTASTASMVHNASSDYLPTPDPTASNKLNPAHMYLGHSEYDKLVIDPLVSPALAPLEDLALLPPLLVQSGGGEVLRDSVSLFAQRLSTAGCDVRYEIYDSQFHIFQPFLKSEVSKTAILSMANWMKSQPTPVSHDFTAIDDIIKAEMKLQNHPRATKVERVHRPAFTYNPISYSPVVEALDTAHPVAKKIIEENSKVQHKDFAVFYKAERTADSSLARLRDLVRL